MASYAEVEALAWEMHKEAMARENPPPSPPERSSFFTLERTMSLLNVVAASGLSAARTYSVFVDIATKSFGNSWLSVAEAILATATFDFGVASLAIALGAETPIFAHNAMNSAGVVIAIIIAGAAGFLQTAEAMGNVEQIAIGRMVAMYAIGLLAIAYVAISSHSLGAYIKEWSDGFDDDVLSYKSALAEYNAWLRQSWSSKKKERLAQAAAELGYKMPGNGEPQRKQTLAGAVRGILRDNPQASAEEIAEILGVGEDKMATLRTTISRVRSKL